MLLVWIGVKLLVPEDEDATARSRAATACGAPIKTVIIADLVMSLDNVIAIAGAAESAGGDHKMPLVVFGLLVSIPIIVWGSQTGDQADGSLPDHHHRGGMLLGWIAGTMAITDPAVVDPNVVAGFPKVAADDTFRYAAGVAGALLVLLIGKALAARRPAAAE